MPRTLVWWSLIGLCLILWACAEDMPPLQASLRTPSLPLHPLLRTLALLLHPLLRTLALLLHPLLLRTLALLLHPPPPLFQDTFDNSASNYTFQ